jgi:adenylate cyclase
VAKEIERKFLVTGEGWRENTQRAVRYRQGYLNDAKDCSIRVRVGAGKAFLNIKSATLGVQRHEYEYPIPFDDANEMLDRFCQGALVDKTRHYVQHEGYTWEVDVFEGDNAGLVVAEIELQDEAERFPLPSWVGAEVSDDPRYYNVCLVKHPYKDW